MHMLVKPGPRTPTSPSRSVALSSYAYLEGIAVEEYIGGGTEADAQTAGDAAAQIKATAPRRAAEQKPKDPDYVPPPADPTTMVAADLTTMVETESGAERAGSPPRASPRRTGGRSPR